MLKKASIILLIVFIVAFQLDQHKKEAQAVAPAIAAISYIATALVAAGAVGTVVYDEATDSYSGSLWDSAKEAYEAMGTQLKTDLENALLYAKAGYLTINSVGGLWDFLHGRIATSQTIAPVTVVFNPASVFSGDCWISVHVSNYDSINFKWDGTVNVYRNYQGDTNNAAFLLNLYVKGTYVKLAAGQYLYTITGFKSEQPVSFGHSTLDWGADMSLAFEMFVLNNYISLANNWNHGGAYDVITLNMGEGSGTYPQTVEQTIPVIAQDGDANRNISIPANPVSLNNATATTPIVNTIGVTTTAEPNEEAQNVGSAVAAAAAAAYAAGYSHSEAAAASVAASNAIISGLSAEEAATLGAEAASVAAAEAATALSTDIAHTRPGDILDFSKLKFAANLFTNKFPFSLPWDLKNMLTTFGTGNTVAPKIPFALGKLNGQVDLAQFNSLAAGVRVLELIAFTGGLLFGTRKLLGGDS